ncbi:MAG: EamA family transporter [Oscillospiraceae bacterium]
MTLKKEKIKSYILLHSILLIYSFTGIFSKMASEKEFLSLEFILYYGLVLILLVVYALLWQQVLKRMPLTTAFANKSVVIVWGMIWGAIIFAEKITPYMVIGAAIIFLGVTLVVTADE